METHEDIMQTLNSLMNHIDQLGDQLRRIDRMTAIGVKEVLDIDEAAIITGYSKGHLYMLTSTKAIPHCKQGNSLRFNKAELYDWMQKTKVKTQAEIDSLATTYVATHR